MEYLTYKELNPVNVVVANDADRTVLVEYLTYKELKLVGFAPKPYTARQHVEYFTYKELKRASLRRKPCC